MGLFDSVSQGARVAALTGRDCDMRATGGKVFLDAVRESWAASLLPAGAMVGKSATMPAKIMAITRFILAIP
jgi:hypothetical protein